jgi:hypothetical protein
VVLTPRANWGRNQGCSPRFTVKLLSLGKDLTAYYLSLDISNRQFLPVYKETWSLLVLVILVGGICGKPARVWHSIIRCQKLFMKLNELYPRLKPGGLIGLKLLTLNKAEPNNVGIIIEAEHTRDDAMWITWYRASGPWRGGGYPYHCRNEVIGICTEEELKQAQLDFEIGE